MGFPQKFDGFFHSFIEFSNLMVVHFTVQGQKNLQPAGHERDSSVAIRSHNPEKDILIYPLVNKQFAIENCHL